MTPLILATALSLMALDAAPSNLPPPTVAPAIVPAPPKVDPASDPDRVICKTEETTGSRFAKRTCMAKAAWDERERKTEEFERRLNEQTVSHSGGGFSGQ